MASGTFVPEIDITDRNAGYSRFRMGLSSGRNDLFIDYNLLCRLWPGIEGRINIDVDHEPRNTAGSVDCGDYCDDSGCCHSMIVRETSE